MVGEKLKNSRSSGLKLRAERQPRRASANPDLRTCTRHHTPLSSTSIMPPIPSTIDEEASNTIALLERRQKDLLDFQIPRLRNCTGPLTLQQQYAAELRDDLDVFSRQLEVSRVSSTSESLGLTLILVDT